MATLTDFIPVNDVNDVTADWVANLIASTLRSEYKNNESLSATRTLLDADTPLQLLDCNGADRIVKMPTANAVNNHLYWIGNTTSSGSYTLTVQDNSGSVTLAILDPDEFILTLPDGSGGYITVGGNAGGSGGADVGQIFALS